MQELIRFDSQNPPGGEAAIARFVSAYLKNLGVSAKIYAFKKGRANVIALLKGKDPKHSLLITPHLDTVPVGRNWHFPPFAAEIHKGRIYGLGATDCKCNLAAALEAINSIVEENRVLGYNLIFAATADEETGSGLGLIPLLNKEILAPTQALILDADDFGIIITQKGLIHLKVKIEGRRAHGAYPWLGLNAIDLALKIIQEIKSYKFIYPKNKYLKGPTINLGTIKGGDKVNIVADWCEFELDIRTPVGMSQKEILKKIKRSVLKYAAKFKIEIEGIQKPYFISGKHPLVSSLSRAMRKIGVVFKIMGSEGATVITFFQDKKIPAVATGFGVEGRAHSNDEYVEIENLYKGAKVLEEFLTHYKFSG